VAARAGLVLPAPGEVRYLRAAPAADARRAAKRIDGGDVSAPPVTPAVPPAQDATQDLQPIGELEP
jgi:hypothetical protein